MTKSTQQTGNGRERRGPPPGPETLPGRRALWDRVLGRAVRRHQGLGAQQKGSVRRGRSSTQLPLPRPVGGVVSLPGWLRQGGTLSTKLGDGALGTRRSPRRRPRSPPRAQEVAQVGMARGS